MDSHLVFVQRDNALHTVQVDNLISAVRPKTSRHIYINYGQGCSTISHPIATIWSTGIEYSIVRNGSFRVLCRITC